MSDLGKANLRISRRQFAAGGIVASAVIGMGSGTAAAASQTIVETSHSIPAAKGTTAGTMFLPSEGEHPGLLMFASAAVSRGANAVVARELASKGWAVLLVDALSGVDPHQVNRDVRAHVNWLTAQNGVQRDDSHFLCSFTAAQPTLSLASRTERRAAAASSLLFGVPAPVLRKSDSRREALHLAARRLHRVAA